MDSQHEPPRKDLGTTVTSTNWNDIVPPSVVERLGAPISGDPTRVQVVHDGHHFVVGYRANKPPQDDRINRWYDLITDTGSVRVKVAPRGYSESYVHIQIP